MAHPASLAGWVAAAASGGSAVAAWCALVRHYAAAWRDQHSAIALVRGGDVNNGGMLIVRKGGWVSVVRRAVAPELALQVGGLGGGDEWWVVV